MRNENTAEFVFTNYFRLPRKTTMENLDGYVGSGYGAIVKYGDKVIVTDVSYRGEFIAAIYKFDRKAESMGSSYVESDITFLKASEKTFEDGGHAIEWALQNCK